MDEEIDAKPLEHDKSNSSLYFACGVRAAALTVVFLVVEQYTAAAATR